MEDAAESPELNHTSQPPFQILSLDGGGLKGLFCAAVLAEIESDLDVSIADHFDLVAGTSTGGLVALGLGAGYRPDDLLRFYIDHGPRIFGKPRSHLARLVRPKYRTDALRAALTELLGSRRLGDSRVPLVVPSFSLERNDVYIFKTPHHPDLARDWRETMVNVALATTAAPTFFAPLRLKNSRLVDGGVWANNPSLVGLAEATGVFGVDISRVRVLSLGTSDPVSNLGSSLDAGGLIHWARNGRAVVLRAPATGSFHTLKYLIGKSNAVRVDHQVPDGLFSLDAVDERRIRGLAEEVARRESPKIRAFMEHSAPKFRPLHP